MGWRGLLAGALALAMLQVVTSNPNASGRVGGLLSGVGDLARRFMSPGVPAFAKPAPSSSSSSGGSSGGGGGIGPPSLAIPLLPGLPPIAVPNPLASYPSAGLPASSFT
jgi:hypothetical protein